MTGPLAQQFAQVREAVNHSATEAHHQDAYGTRPDWYHAAHDALSSIERHVQEMEKARYQLRVIDADTGEPVDGNELEPAPWGHATTLWFTARDKPRVARVEVVPIERENGDE